LENLEEVYKMLPEFSVTRVFSLVGTCTSMVQKSPKVSGEKGLKQASKCTSAEKGTCVTNYMLYNFGNREYSSSGNYFS
jgi:hypothetical protein